MLARPPAASAPGISVPWASFSLTIKGNKAPGRRSEPAHVCSVGFCMVMEGKSEFYVYGCSARMCACAAHAFWSPRRPRKGTRVRASQVTVSLPGPPEEQPVILTTEPFRQPSAVVCMGTRT